MHPRRCLRPYRQRRLLRQTLLSNVGFSKRVDFCARGFRAPALVGCRALTSCRAGRRRLFIPMPMITDSASFVFVSVYGERQPFKYSPSNREIPRKVRAADFYATFSFHCLDTAYLICNHDLHSLNGWTWRLCVATAVFQQRISQRRPSRFVSPPPHQQQMPAISLPSHLLGRMWQCGP